MVFKAKQWDHLRGCWHLTDREIEVAKLVCQGLNNNQIKAKLKIKYNTVRAHLGNVFRKVQVEGKASLILEFVRVIEKAKL